MSMRSLISFGLLAAIAAYAEAWPNGYDDEFDAWRLARRSHDCSTSGAKCFSTQHCCKGFVCAAFDEVFERNAEADNPKLPGFCVKEKDLEPCSTGADCSGDSRCVTLGRSGERYCVPRDQDNSENDVYRKSKGGIGSTCQTDSDCRAYNEDRTEKLCCQEVLKGRSISRMCDPITRVSKCIRKRN